MSKITQKVETRVCQRCGAVFKVVRFWQKFCSVACKQKDYWTKKLNLESGLKAEGNRKC